MKINVSSDIEKIICEIAGTTKVRNAEEEYKAVVLAVGFYKYLLELGYTSDEEGLSNAFQALKLRILIAAEIAKGNRLMVVNQKNEGFINIVL